MNYTHSFDDRRALAMALEKMFADSGFHKDVKSDVNEDVYVRHLTEMPGATIVVYSTIHMGVARDSGADAIRCMVLWTRRDGAVRALIKEGRVNRTGTIDGIVARTLGRMRDAFKTLRDRERNQMRCRCGSPLFTSKNSNEVCVDTCWIK